MRSNGHERTVCSDQRLRVLERYGIYVVWLGLTMRNEEIGKQKRNYKKVDTDK